MHDAPSVPPLLAAYAGKPVTRRPVWFMRQAGRSLPEFRALREGVPMLEACLRPDMAAEITCQPVRRLDVDAAIFFSDIVVPLRLAGVAVDIVPGVGPVLEHPVRTAADVTRLPELDPAALDPVREGVAAAVAELGTTPLIGFAGAPFTLASYMIEGRPDHALPHTHALMERDPKTWQRLLTWLTHLTTQFLRAQAGAGAVALQLFDSWAGRLTTTQYESMVAPHSAAVLGGVADLGVPRVHFGTETAHLLTAMHSTGADVMGIASDIGLDKANDLLGGTVPLQGNLDPALLTAPWPVLESAVRDVIVRGNAAPGHVFNLGHGVPPTTDPDVLRRVVDLVHSIPT